MRGILVADRVGWIETSVLFFTVCGPKFTELRTRTGMIAFCNAVFLLTIILLLSGDISDQVALSEIAPEN